ncbi:uncharacterized protein LOC129791954 [Lutzomyia longipalpis]|uniref:uncharacterized protein LOC129791954 n=1 Tax=Lutzomyia longipalpis TaxID=7200 RepID=UPI002483A821|nr:uncharacterized protein LOC129791954 [Lutzomyia longipalpis]
MSSVQDKMPPLEKKIPIKRSSSFQRLKCSAVLQFQVAGSKFKKEALRTLLENLINYSRDVLQKTYTTLSTQAFKLVCAVVVWILDTFVKHLNLKISDSVLVNWLLPQWKSEGANEILSRPAVQPPQRVVAPTQSPAAVDAVDAKVKHFLPHSPSKVEPKYTKTTPLLRTVIYGGAALACLEFLTLIFLLRTSQIPPGLIFQLSCLAFIGNLLFMISTRTSTVGLRSKALLAKFTTTPKRPLGENLCEHHTRLSRSRRKTCYLNLTDKSLSKIKLL